MIEPRLTDPKAVPVSLFKSVAPEDLAKLLLVTTIATVVASISRMPCVSWWYRLYSGCGQPYSLA